MTDQGRAVFLSYASQDAQAAQHLCNALRAAGVEVWFDQSELRGGDAWDASIRRQIKACALFIPIVSRNTHSRDEGYFRLEWKLGVDRSHLMAGDRPFLLPVVIDDTSDQDDRVPERFREVQWTRLPAGMAAEGFVERVRRLVSPEATAPVPTPMTAASTPIASTSISTSTAAARPTGSKFSSFVPWMLAALLIAVLGYSVADKFLMHRHATQASEAPPVAPERTAAVADQSIAVLPFADMSEKKDQEYFSDGLAEELIEQLGKTPGLKVIARTSSFSFKGKSDDIASIAAKLKVTHIVEGSVRRSGNQLRISTEVIRADSGEQVWSATYDREFKDVFKVQNEIAASVVSALKLTLGKGQAADRGQGTTNPDAYAALLLGRQQYRQSTTAAFKTAIATFQKAIGLDPHYAEAYADLAMAQNYLGDLTGDRPLLNAADGTAQRAVDLDPHLGRAYSVRAYLRSLHFDWVGAEADAKQGLAMDPAGDRVFIGYGSILANLGRLDEAAAAYRQASEQDPLDSGVWSGLGTTLTALKDYPAAYAAFRHGLASAPDNMYRKYGLAILQLVDGKTRESLATFRSIDFEGFRYQGEAMARHTLGDAKGSQEFLDKLISTVAGTGAYQIAETYAWRGEKDAAFEWLERSYRQQDGGLISVKIDPPLASLHSDPRFAALLRKLNFPPEAP